MKLKRKTKTIIAVGGGKGGVGKSICAIGIASVLADSSKRVCLADFDLGAANLHIYLGIFRQARSLADFLLRKVASIEDILIETKVRNLTLISGSDFIPGMANPSYAMKMKMIRHVLSVERDFTVLDLGAGAYFNTLDFFGIADRGIVVTTPEPGAIMNAYSFIKGALFRKVQNVFRRHPDIGPVLEEIRHETESEGALHLEWFERKVMVIDPEMYPLINEIREGFRPSLVVSDTPGHQGHHLVENLINLCLEKLGITVTLPGILPYMKGLGSNLTDVPGFLFSQEGTPLLTATRSIIDGLLKDLHGDAGPLVERPLRTDFDDEDIEALSDIIDGLESSILDRTGKNLWKLRLFFKPREVIDFLMKRGVREEIFFHEG